MGLRWIKIIKDVKIALLLRRRVDVHIKGTYSIAAVRQAFTFKAL